MAFGLTTDLWVLICAPGERRQAALSAFDSLNTPHTRRVLVTTTHKPVVDISGSVVHPISEEASLATSKSQGLDFIADQYEPGDQWDVLILDIDTRLERRDVDLMRVTMRELQVGMAVADLRLSLQKHMWYVAGAEDAHFGLATSLAVVVAGERGIRYDSAVSAGAADQNFEWQHRVAGGTVLVGGTTLTQYPEAYDLEETFTSPDELLEVSV